MELDRYYELRTILQQWRSRLAESIRGRSEASGRWLARLRRMYEAEGAGEEFTLWLDRWCRQAAIQFILRILFLRVLEDRELLGVTRLRNTDGQQMWASLTRSLGAASYVQWCCWDAAHLLPDLFGPTEYDLVLPDDDLAQRFLDDVWRRPDPDRPGWLRFDFRPDPNPASPGGPEAGDEGQGDPGFHTRFIGDLYQELDAEIRARYALLQTPRFISQFILEHTLLKRFEELAQNDAGGKDFRQVTLIDPTCGSGHFLVDAFWHFVARYEAAELSGGAGEPGRAGAKFSPAPLPHRSPAKILSSAKRAAIARTIIETHLHGCDINPYATALTRFRLILAACDYAQPTSLADFRDLHFNVATIDSLIPYEKLMVSGVQADSATARLLGQPEAIERALPLLRKRYDVVVGNPPYITAQDATKRDLYREHYASAYRSFGLSAPFTERFLKLAVEGGYAGLINSNAFARRQFGKKLIEEVLPKYDLQATIDLSGAHIPGHGTPTLIIFAQKQSPTESTVLVLSNVRGEPSLPNVPSQGLVWQSVIKGYQEGHNYQDDYVDVYNSRRESLARHPWKFAGPASRLFARIQDRVDLTVDDIAASNGRDIHTGLNDIFIGPSDHFRRLGISTAFVRPCIKGENLRDWTIVGFEHLLFPYTVENTELEIIRWPERSGESKYLRSYFDALSKRRNYGKTILELGFHWYAFGYVAERDWSKNEELVYSFISTHVHFSLIFFGGVTVQSAPRLTLRTGNLKLIYGLLNSVVSDFCLKQVCFDKRAGKDPVRDTYYEFASTNIGQIPIPKDIEATNQKTGRMLVLVEGIIELSDKVLRLTASKLFELENEAYHAWNAALDGYTPPHLDLPPPFTTARELRAARDQLIALRQDIRSRMIFLQEEMDWLAYEMYGLLKGKAPLAEDYLSQGQYQAARLELGQRPFEIAGQGYTGDWPKKYKPAPLPAALRPLTEERIAITEANPDIALLEDPLYKRRWIPPDYRQEFREAARWWLAEKLEFALEQAGQPLSLKAWARLLGQDERVNAALAVLAGSPMFDLEKELLSVIRANAAPNRPEHYLKPSGLRKLYAAKGSQAVPQYKRADFSDAVTWKLRGKLNIPRERFIHYVEFDHTGRGVDAPDSGGPWFGWAGWDAPQRADALAYLLDKANRAGWELHYRQCGLRAALRDLLPALADLPAADRAEFEAIAGLCGIGLTTACYCRAYRDGVEKGQPGVPGVGAEVLGVKALKAAGKKPVGKGKQQGKDSGQMKLEM